MKQAEIPLPDVMKFDRQEWAKQLHLSNFVNTYYQYRDLLLCKNIKRVLIIGPGQGLSTVLLRWRDYDVITLDIDETFKPDHIGSVHDMSMFEDGQFDAVVCSHVLEHLAEPYLNTSLKEIARIGRYALIYLPIAGRHFQARIKGDAKGIDIPLTIDIFNYFHKPDGITSRYAQGQHFWEVGRRGFRVRDLIDRFSQWFEVIHNYRNRDWYYSWNFIVKSKKCL
ncbi:MAG: class I SAM-dependent methyltransferase [Deltaproteobacteria bacterium]|nr:class I SAM-dependent methyltransferase [Candidatus Poribacteria bacterium]MBM4300100.1 class I SAM-dependent methyltransferase [Deltaproteobacteria bacterium]